MLELKRAKKKTDNGKNNEREKKGIQSKNKRNSLLPLASHEVKRKRKKKKM